MVTTAEKTKATTKMIAAIKAQPWNIHRAENNQFVYQQAWPSFQNYLATLKKTPWLIGQIPKDDQSKELYTFLIPHTPASLIYIPAEFRTAEIEMSAVMADPHAFRDVYIHNHCFGLVVATAERLKPEEINSVLYNISKEDLDNLISRWKFEQSLQK